MDMSRQGQLARVALLDILRKKGLTVNSSLYQEMGNVAKNLNAIDPNLQTNPDEVLEFMLILAKEVFTDFEKRVLNKLNEKKSG